jgi:hypothetical protein
LDPQSVAIGFTGDGIPYLAVVNHVSNNVSILKRVHQDDGTFTFQLQGQPYPIGDGNSPPWAVAVADLRGNGKLDLVVSWGTTSGHVTVLLGNGDGTFDPNPNRRFDTGAYPTSLAVGDFNRDGHPDIVTANDESGTVSVLLGNGDGTFQPAQDVTVGGYPTGVAVGDVIGNGIPDLVVTGDTVQVLLGNGDGTFRHGPSNLLAGGNPYSPILAPFSGSGHLDLAVVDFAPQGAVSVLLNDGNWGGLSPGRQPPHGHGPGAAPSGLLPSRLLGRFADSGNSTPAEAAPLPLPADATLAPESRSTAGHLAGLPAQIGRHLHRHGLLDSADDSSAEDGLVDVGG